MAAVTQDESAETRIPELHPGLFMWVHGPKDLGRLLQQTLGKHYENMQEQYTSNCKKKFQRIFLKTWKYEEVYVHAMEHFHFSPLTWEFN